MKRYKLEIQLSELAEGEVNPALSLEFNSPTPEDADALRREVQWSWVKQGMDRNDYRCWMSSLTSTS